MMMEIQVENHHFSINNLKIDIMKKQIENYRGFNIEFDTEYEKFSCIITDELTKESISFKAVKNFIDEYRKSNQDFKPFWVEAIPDMYTTTKLIKIVGIRKDGRFISETPKGEKQQVSDYDLAKYMLSKPENEVIMEQYKLTEQLGRKQIAENDRQKKELISKLKIVTLKQYKQSIL